MITMLRCQKCGNGYEYAGPQLKSNPVIHCPHCDKPVRATAMLLLNRGDAIFTPLTKEQKLPAEEIAKVELPRKTQLEAYGIREKVARIYKPLPETGEEAQELFWAYVRQRGPDDCWPFKGTKDEGDYGRFYLRGETYIASRIAYWISRKKDPGQFMVGHSCDNPPCCNPRHLFVTDAQGNALDKAIKGRCHNQKWNARSSTIDAAK